MVAPLSIRLDDTLRRELEQEASTRGSPLSQLVRELLEAGVRQARRERIRRDSARVAHYVASSPEAQALFDEVGGTHTHGR